MLSNKSKSIIKKNSYTFLVICFALLFFSVFTAKNARAHDEDKNYRNANFHNKDYGYYYYEYNRRKHHWWPFHKKNEYTPEPTPPIVYETPSYCTPEPTETPYIPEYTATPFCDNTPTPYYTETPTYCDTETPEPTLTSTPTPYPYYTDTPYYTPTEVYYTPTPPQYDTPEPTPPKEPCKLRISRRGKGDGSRWNKESSPFSNLTLVHSVFISIGGTEVHQWKLDPCNRVDNKKCKSEQSDPPEQYTYNGVTYTIIGPGRVLGGECSITVQKLVSPLVLDFKMNGIEFTSSPSASFNFGKGKRPTYWIANGEDVAFLAIDKNGNRIIDNIDELFGDKTKPGDENKSYKNGFEALASYDSDGNGRIDIRDKDFKNLRLWFDKNGDAVTNHGELKRLSSMQVKSIVLNYEYIDEFGDANGNLSQQRSMVFLKGQPPSGVGIYDVYFANTVK